MSRLASVMLAPSATWRRSTDSNRSWCAGRAQSALLSTRKLPLPTVATFPIEGGTMNVRRMAAVLAVAVAAVLGQAGAAGAASGGQLRIEPGWYAGHHVSFLQPSVFSSKPNGGTFACFGLGPNLTGIDRPTAPLYVIVDPSATQDHCDGDPR